MQPQSACCLLCCVCITYIHTYTYIIFLTSHMQPSQTAILNTILNIYAYFSPRMHPIGQTDVSFFFFKYIYIYFLPRTCRRLICSACCCAWAAPEPTLSLATPFFYFSCFLLVPFAWAAPAATLSLSTPFFFFFPTTHTHTPGIAQGGTHSVKTHKS